MAGRIATFNFDPRAGSPIYDMLGGAATSILTVTFGLSYSVLIFSGPLTPFLAYGIAVTFISSAIISGVLAFGSSFPFATGGPESSTAAMTAILAATLVERMLAADPSALLLGPTLITLGLASLATGLVLCAFGMTRLGRAMRYVPYPVVGGFLGATGFLILLGAVRVITGHRLQFSTLPQFANPAVLAQLCAALAVTVVLYLTRYRSNSPLGLPAILIAGVIAAQIGFWMAGMTPNQVQEAGWVLKSPAISLTLAWADIAHYPWSIFGELTVDLIAVIFVTASSSLFNTAGVEVAIQREANLERELNVTGIANILSGIFLGYTGCISVSRTVLNYKTGARSRLSGLTVSVICLLMLAGAPVLLGYIPTFVLGGLLIYLGADLLHKWIVDSRKRLSATEYVSLLAIIVIIVQWGFVFGVLIGVIIGCATFALSASRIDSIKFHFDGSEFRSSLDRSRDDQALLSARGGAIQGLNLQSYLFFGSANRLAQHVKSLLQLHPECRYLLFDFKLVTGIDSSAAYSFTQIKRAADERGVHLILVHLAASADKSLRSSGFLAGDVHLFPDLDHALEWCENEIIARHQDRDQEEASLRDWFTQMLGNEQDACELINSCTRVEVIKDEIVVSAGAAAESMHFILDGRVGVMIRNEAGQLTRVRSLGRYTTIGEMGLVSGAPRSATIKAEIPSVLYVLSKTQFEAIKMERPQLGQKLLTYFMSVMAERLTFANRMISVLQR